ncbi:hypothetical protein ZWY2020_021716 [Hordeum vulgare]|nr:hypothetical protein ZWY2020_021716 [Hordeum vulgare]
MARSDSQVVAVEDAMIVALHAFVQFDKRRAWSREGWTMCLVEPLLVNFFWCRSCFGRGRGLVSGSATFRSVCTLHIFTSSSSAKSRMRLKRRLMPSLLLGALFRYCRHSYRLPVFDSILIAPNTFGVVMGTPSINRVVLRLCDMIQIHQPMHRGRMGSRQNFIKIAGILSRGTSCLCSKIYLMVSCSYSTLTLEQLRSLRGFSLPFYCQSCKSTKRGTLCVWGAPDDLGSFTIIVSELGSLHFLASIGPIRFCRGLRRNIYLGSCEQHLTSNRPTFSIRR